MNKAATKTFTADLVRHGSFGLISLGRQESTMDLHLSDDRLTGFIEWDIPALDTTEEIGLTFELRSDVPRGQLGAYQLIDYDGIMDIPKEALDLLVENGIHVPEEYWE